MAHNTRQANLISKAKPDCHRSRTIAIPSRHTIPATPHSPHDPTRSPIRHDTKPHNQVTLYTTPHAHGLRPRLWHHTQGRHRAGREPKESLFIWEAGWHDRATPWCLTRAVSMRKTPLPRKTTSLPSAVLSLEKHYFYAMPCLSLPISSLLPYAATLTSVNKML